MSRENKSRDTDGIMIRSSDKRWRVVNKNEIENKLKSTNSKIILSTSDSKETLDKRKFS